MADIDVVNTVFEAMTVEELEIPQDVASTNLGSNLIPLMLQLVTWVHNRLKDGYKPRQIKDYIKANHPSGKGISWGQMRLIIERRRAHYQEKYAEANPEPVE